MDEYNYNYKLTIATHTYLIQTVSFIIIEGYVNHDILASLYQAFVCKDAVFNHFFQLPETLMNGDLPETWQKLCVSTKF